ncbi:hypothetical protein KSS87_021211 [Heliosperma pusillum]|nr:hypothetical protein KSS87_021211 [Heliosperma pusillum]
MQGSIPSLLEFDEIVISKLIEGLERGKKSTEMMRNIILEHYPGVKVEGFQNNNNENHLKAFDYHSTVALDTYVTSLSMLKSFNIEPASTGKRKLHPDDSLSGNGRRDCYKRRKNVESKEEVAHTTDDAFGWRKYGQKNIQNYTHPSDSPEEQSSAIVISFDRSNMVDPLLFPSSAFLPPVRRSLNNCADDQTRTTSSVGDSTNPVSEKSEEILLFDNCSSNVAMDDLDEDYSSIMADFSEFLPDWWTC